MDTFLYILIIIGLTEAVLIFLFPLIIPETTSRIDSSDLPYVFVSPTTRYYIVASISGCIPVFFIVMFRSISFQQTIFASTAFRIIFFNLIIDASLLFLIFSERNLYLVPSLIFGRSILYTNTVLSAFYKYSDQTRWDSTIFFISALGCNFSSLLFLASYYSNSSKIWTPLNIAAIICSIASSFVLILGGIKRFQTVIIQRNFNILTSKERSMFIVLASVIIYNTIVLWIVATAAIIGAYVFSEGLRGYIFGETVTILVVGVFFELKYFQDSTSPSDDLDMKRTFIRYISHEIRTPLNIVQLGLKLLHQDIILSNSSSPHIKTVEEVMNSCNTTVTILNDLLIYDGLESGTLQMNCTDVDVMTFLQESIQPYYVQARLVGVNLALDISADRVDMLQRFSMHIDKGKMHQVMRNLLSNALKFTKSGGHVSVHAFEFQEKRPSNSRKVNGERVRIFHKTIRIEVVDDGIGISKENLPKIFKERIQFDLNELKENEGAGLGLWISRAIVERHGGKINVSSQGVGRGAIVSLELPMYTTTVIRESSSDKSGKPVLGLDNVREAITNMTHALRRGSSRILSNIEKQASNGHDGLSPVAEEDHQFSIQVKPLTGLTRRFTKRLSEVHPELKPSAFIGTGQSERESDAVPVFDFKNFMIRDTGELSPRPPTSPLELHPSDIQEYDNQEAQAYGEDGNTDSDTVVSAWRRNANNATKGSSIISQISMRDGSIQDPSLNTNDNALFSFGEFFSTKQSELGLDSSLQIPTEELPSNVIPRRKRSGDVVYDDEVKIRTSFTRDPTTIHRPIFQAAVDLLENGEESPGVEGAAKEEEDKKADSKMKLLFVDDVKMSRKMVMRLLLSHIDTSIELCDEAEDGVQAVAQVKRAMAQNTPYDAVLMDYMMPNMDGPTAAKEMRAMGFKGAIIGITGNTSPLDVKIFLAGGANKVLSKPLELHLLLSAMKEVRVPLVVLPEDAQAERKEARSIGYTRSESAKAVTDIASASVARNTSPTSIYSGANGSIFQDIVNLMSSSFKQKQGRDSSSSSTTSLSLKSNSTSLKKQHLRRRTWGEDGSAPRNAEISSNEHGVARPVLEKILIVEDDHHHRMIIQKILSGRGIKSDDATDGIEALSQIRESILTLQPYDVVIMNYLLVNMDGPTAAKEMRAMGYKGRVIGVLENDNIDERNYYLSQGADEVIVKPFVVEDLLSMLLKRFMLPKPKQRSSFSNFFGARATSSTNMFSSPNSISHVSEEAVRNSSNTQKDPFGDTRGLEITSSSPSKAMIQPNIRLENNRTSATTGSTGCVMVVSADDVIRRARAVYFRSKYHYCDEAINGMEAISKVRRSFEQKKPFDAIVMDFRMPNMDGPSAAFEIRKMGYKGKIVGVLGSKSTESVQVFTSQGADLVICEPIDFKSLTSYLQGSDRVLDRLEEDSKPPSDVKLSGPPRLASAKSSQRSPRGRASLRVRAMTQSNSKLSIEVVENELDDNDTRSPTKKSPRKAEHADEVHSFFRSLRSRSPKRVGSLEVDDFSDLEAEGFDQNDNENSDVSSGRSTRYSSRSHLTNTNCSPINSLNTPPGSKKFNILLVDENTLRRRATAKVLLPRTMLCQEASDGIQAIEKVGASQQFGPVLDVIIVMNVLSGMDGPTCVRAIRAMGFSGKMIGIFEESSLSYQSDMFLSQGADVTFSIPIPLSDFDIFMKDSQSHSDSKLSKGRSQK